MSTPNIRKNYLVKDIEKLSSKLISEIPGDQNDEAHKTMVETVQELKHELNTLPSSRAVFRLIQPDSRVFLLADKGSLGEEAFASTVEACVRKGFT